MKKNSFVKGLTDGLPICFGYFSVAFAFGIFAVQNGIPVLGALFMSMANVTSAGQLAAVPIIVSGGTLLELAASQLVINLRYSLMSVSLSQKLDNSVSLFDRFVISFVNTDEVFAVASGKKGEVGRKYMYGLIITPFFGWSIGTLVGAVAGDILPAIVISSLGVAIYGMFTAIVVPVVKAEKAVAACVAIAVLLSCAFWFVPLLKAVPQGFVIIICAVVASALLAIAAPVDAPRSDEDVLQEGQVRTNA